MGVQHAGGHAKQWVHDSLHCPGGHGIVSSRAVSADLCPDEDRKGRGFRYVSLFDRAKRVCGFFAPLIVAFVGVSPLLPSDRSDLGLMKE